MERRLWIIGLALAGAICLGGIWAWQRARHYERLFHLVRLDPLGLTTFGSEPVTTAQIVLFGDSRAAAWLAPAGYSIANRGIPGHTSTQARLRYRWHVSSLKPKLVIVQVGVNDLTALAVFGHEEENIIHTTIANLSAIVNEARSDGSRVILTTIFGLGPNAFERLDPATAQIQAAIEQVNQAIRAMAAPDVVIFDSAAILADESGYVAEQYRDDILHINAAGYRVLNEALGNLLAAQLRS
ncbi:GDSL family lipase [Chloroflexus islandicus]|uniref:GDSL family lipase n=1 Tax=Chloroflexus islandicus TaxID=1707952 RepID=A0A178M5I1_9CHLR|nr:SGNH/GDSL hydrolase family protein [Chloroflexus islandicus]OAN43816.1 GDSL family lipase [Chloroflexus islandicus]